MYISRFALSLSTPRLFCLVAIFKVESKELELELDIYIYTFIHTYLYTCTYVYMYMYIYMRVNSHFVASDCERMHPD